MLNIDKVQTSDPRQFWNLLKTLGPRKSSRLPDQIYDSNGGIRYLPADVLNTWKLYYEDLYKINSDTFDSDFYSSQLSRLEMLESNMCDPLFSQQSELNNNISNEELTYIFAKARSNTASGADSIPYDVLRVPALRDVLKNLFQLCFDIGKVLSDWNKTIVFPIYKRGSNSSFSSSSNGGRA